MISDPVDYWPLNEGSGTTAVDTAGGQNGTLGAGASWIAGKIESNAVRFDKTVDGHLTFPQIDLGTIYTVAFWVWVRDPSSGADGVVIGGPSNYYALYFDDTTLYHSAGPSNFVNVGHGGLASLRAWNHVAVTRNGATVQFYVNGVALGAFQTLSTPANTLRLDTLGSYNGFNFPSQVDLDDVRFYTRALSSTEVGDLYAYTGAGGHSVAAGIAGEGDTAMPIGRRKARALGTATEGDLAQLARPGRRRPALTVTATDTARPLAATHRRAAGAAAEPNVAQALGRRKTRAVGTAIEADASQALAKRHRRALAPAAEADVAVPITRAAPAAHVLPVGAATETAQALGARALKRRALAACAEADASGQIRPQRRRSVGLAVDVGAALVIGRRKRLAMVAASESDLALVFAGADMPAPAVITVTDRPAVLSEIGDRRS